MQDTENKGAGMKDTEHKGVSRISYYRAVYSRELANLLISHPNRAEGGEILDRIFKISSICTNLSKIEEFAGKEERFNQILNAAFEDAEEKKNASKKK